MKMRGAVFLLYAEISSVMTLIASCVTNTLTANSETVDVTDKSVLFRELLENAGISSVSVKAQGVCNNSASFAFYAKQSLAVHYLTPVLSQTLAKFIRVYLRLHHLNRRVSITKASYLRLRLNHREQHL